MPLPDLASALASFQQAFTAGYIQLQAGVLDPAIYVFMDRPNEEVRLTYVRLKGRTVTALVQFVPTDKVEGEPCFSVGWAVPAKFRGHGRSGEAFLAALKELRHGMSRQGMKAFWVEGVVGADNIASQRMAEKVISAPTKTGTDKFADVQVVQYLRRIDAQTEM